MTELAVSSPIDASTARHLVSALILTWSFVIMYRWIMRRSAVLAYLFAAGVIFRSATGVALFLISLFEWPLFSSLQMGGGFWTLALDSKTYYDIASNAAFHGLTPISNTFPSPMYLRTLATWMWIFGVSPASALLLNVATYAASIVLIIITAATGHRSRSHDDLGAIFSVVTFTFSPALLIFSTQPLKDALCVLLLIGVVCGASLWWTEAQPKSGTALRLAVAVTLMSVGVYGLAGIRPYVCLFVMAAIPVAAAYGVIKDVYGARRIGYALQHMALIASLWLVFSAGAGPYESVYRAAVLSALGSARAPVDTLDNARAGFVASGGATATASFADAPPKGSTGSMVRRGRLGSLIVGFAVFFVPVTALAATSIVTFSGGRGLLGITDLDTIAIDLTVAAILWLLVRSLKRAPPTSATIFSLALGLLLISTMGYVVTNYGTLFRLRIMAITPLWMLPVLLPRRPQKRTNGIQV